jgi:hypothetical protein
MPPVTGNNVDAGFGLAGRGAADGQRLAVGREAVAAVAAGGVADVERLGSAAIGGDGHDFAGFIEDEGLAVVGPVRRFHVTLG